MRFAYADPPYLGCGKLYAKQHPEALLWDDPVTHRALIGRLMDEYQDGWAMSCSVPSLSILLPMCPPAHRILAWVKPFAIFKPNVGLAYTWEPVVFFGGRRISRKQKTVRDFVSCNVTLKKGLTGAKPTEVMDWLLDCLNVEPGDTVDDLFPGTGIMGERAALRTGFW
jgi:hypothetical protein